MLSRVWIAAQAVWGHKWASANGELPIDDSGALTIAGSLWAEGLRGLTERQVLDAFGRLAKAGSEWPPNLPELRRAAFGIPSFATVNAELLTTTSEKRSAFARLAWSFIVDPYAYRHCSAKDAERLRRDAYEQACEHLMTGGGLPPEAAGEIEHHANPKPHGIPTTRDERIAYLQQKLGPDFSEVAANARSEDEVRRHHKRQEQESALHELGAQYRSEDAEQELAEQELAGGAL